MMDPRLIALKLVLDELGIDPSIDTLDDRKRVQKAVYLAQIRGLDLGYRFSWYLMGPYSPALTRDYYALEEAIHSGSTEYQNRALKPHLLERLQSVRPILQVPPDLGLTQESWLELLASYHYLRCVQGSTGDQAEHVLSQRKPHLCAYIEYAARQLEEYRLLPCG